MQGFNKIVIFVSLIFVTACWSGGRYAGSFLEWGSGARPMALADAAAAMTGNGETFYYNPASLVFMKNPFVHLMYAPTFGVLSAPMAHYHIAGIAMPLESKTALALNWARFSVNDIPHYPELDGNSFSERSSQFELRPDGIPIGHIRDVEDVIYLSLAKNIEFNMPLGWWYEDVPVDFPIGVNFKILRQVLGEHDATGLGMDAGAMMRFHLGRFLQNRNIGQMTMGISIKDVSRTELTWDTEYSDKIPSTSAWGVGYSQPIQSIISQLNVFYTRKHQYNTDHLVALELLMPFIALRLGYHSKGLTAGAGFSGWRFHIDYAFVSNEFQDVHRLSCGINLGALK